MTKTFVGDTSPIDVDAIDTDGDPLNLSDTGFDADLPNSLAFVRKRDDTTNLFSRAPIERPGGSLANGNLRVEIAKADFPTGSEGWYWIWFVFNDVAVVDQLTLEAVIFEVGENPP